MSARENVMLGIFSHKKAILCDGLMSAGLNVMIM